MKKNEMRKIAREKAVELVSKMTVEEMASQLRYDAAEVERLGIKSYNWWGEGLHGVARAGMATGFPQSIGMAACFDPEMIEKIGEIVSTEARAKYNAFQEEDDHDIYKGLTLWSPNVNIFRDPRWGRGQETFGEDPYLTSRLGVAYVKGLQGEGDHLRVAACAKHFAVHSGPENIRHYFNAKVNKKDMWETYLPAFEACVKEGEVEAVMGAYNRTNDEPCCAHEELMEKILRGKWEFQGHFVSDCWAIRDFHETHMITKNPRESVALAMKRGCDVNCGSTYLCIMQAYKEKKITKKQIETAAIRLFTTRYMLGEMDGSEYDQIPYDVIECKEHLAYAKSVAEKTMVLLKNDGTLPLKKDELKTIAIIGPNANSRAALAGNYHGTASRYWTVSEGIMQALAEDDIRVLCADGCHLYADRTEHLAVPDDRVSEAVSVAKRSDLVILCVGLDETLEGEEGDTGNSAASGDKPDLLLPKSQRQLIAALEKVGTPTILLNMTGSAMDLSFAKNSDMYKAIIQVWYPGAQGGLAVADVLFGKTSPSGKLPITFYETTEELPEFTDYAMKGRTYRYMEKAAQYPFGYGLNYADIKVTDAKIVDEENLKNSLKDAASIEDQFFTVEAKVKNDGKMASDDIVQVYIKDIKSQYAVKNHSLCGMARVALQPGEEAVCEIQLSGKAFMVYDEDGNRKVDSDSFVLYVGTSQPDEVSVVLTGKKPLEISVQA